MKKITLLLVMILSILVIPFGVFADEEENNKVNVYFFKGDGCGFCEAGLEWFDEIEDKYGERFELHEYETWYDEKNAAIMNAVAEARGENVQGVPYIIVGDQSWNGFDDSYKNEILSKIKAEFKIEKSERYDIMTLVDLSSINADKTEEKDDSYADDIAVTVLLLIVVAGVGFGIYTLRKSN